MDKQQAIDGLLCVISRMSDTHLGAETKRLQERRQDRGLSQSEVQLYNLLVSEYESRDVLSTVSADFDNRNRTHDWRNHIPHDMRAIWSSLCDEARIVAYWIAKEAADAEEWD